MKARLQRIVLITFCFAALAGASCAAQSKPGGPPPGAPPGGGPPGGPGGNGPGGPAGSGGQGGPGSSNSARARGSGQTAHNSLQFGPVGRWWDDKSVVRTVGLSKGQQQKMDAVFDANKPAILSSYKTLLNEQSKLDALNKDPNVDKTQLFSAIDAVSQARASLQKATSEMLLQIRQEMSPDQVTKLEKLQ
jgi:Spy/CpxP family protein refolding chaperone